MIIKLPQHHRDQLDEFPLPPTPALIAGMLLALLLENDLAEADIHSVSAGAVVDPSMARRADRRDIAWIVGSAIAHSTDVMGFQIWLAVRTKEWSGLPATLTNAGSAGQDIATDRLAALVDAPAGPFSRFLIAGACRGHGSTSKSGQIKLNSSLVRIVLLRLSIGEGLDRHQVEDDRAPDIPKTIRCRLSGGVYADKFTKETKLPSSILLLEKEQILSISDMISDRFVATGEGHIPFLALTEVAEHLAIGGPAIVIAVLEAAFAGDGEDDRILRRRDDAALALTAEMLMEIAPAVVSTSTDKVPKGHQAIPGVELSDHRYSKFARHPLSLRRPIPAEAIALNVR